MTMPKRPAIDINLTKKKIKAIFNALGAGGSASLKAKKKENYGKVYELFVLSELLSELDIRGYDVSYSNPGAALAFKSGPGLLKQSDPHFDIREKKLKSCQFQVFVNVEFSTLGISPSVRHPIASGMRRIAKDLSCFHELDIGVFLAGQTGRPAYDKVALGIECKAVTTLTKQIVRGVLGLRRELSFLDRKAPAILLGGPSLQAQPTSELRLVTTDARVKNYIASPSVFGIEMVHLKP